MINPKIVDYIKQYSSQGYSTDKIRQFLVSNNVSEKDVDDAIAFVNQSSASGNTNQNLQSAPQNNAFEMQLRSYMQTQLNSGYNIALIKSTLIGRGYNPTLVNRIASEIGNVNINVKHEVNISKGTIIGIVATIFVVGIIIFGILNLSLIMPDESLLDITVSTSAYSYIPGETVNYQVHVSNMGTMKRFDATIKCLIINDEGDVVTRREDTLAVETTTGVNRDIKLPTTIKPGKYTVKIISDYDGKQATSSTEIEVVQSAADKKPPSYVPPITDTGSTPDTTPSTGTGTHPTTPIPSTGDIDVPSPTAITSTGRSFGEVMTEVKTTSASDPNSAAKICSKLSDEQKDVCYSIVADTSGQKSYCADVVDADYRDNCYMSFLLNMGDTEVCDEMTNAENKEFCNQLKLIQLMDKYYREGDTEKMTELSKQLNPDIYGNTPEIQTYEHVYSEPLTIMDIMNVDADNGTADDNSGNETPAEAPEVAPETEPVE